MRFENEKKMTDTLTDAFSGRVNQNVEVDNSNRQVILSGNKEKVDLLQDVLKEKK